MTRSIYSSIYAIIVGCVILQSTCRASVTLTIGTGGWGNATTSNVTGMDWGIIVDTSGGNFSGASASLQTALLGFSIPSNATPATPIEIGNTSYYFALAQTQTQVGGPGDGFVNGLMNTDNFALTSPVASGEHMGVLWFGSNTTTAGSSFGFQALGGANTVPADNSTITTGITSSPGLAAYSITAAPEPSRTLLAFLGLGLCLMRRRRK
jgi:hypothetical protein